MLPVNFLGTVGRLHLARVLVENKCVQTTKVAFDRYIGDGGSCCVKHERLDYAKAIRIIHDAGGVSVLAHPGSSVKDADIHDIADAGIKGLEVFHSKHTSGMIEKYLNIAKKYNLIPTGGSDCHGMIKKGKYLLGTVTVEPDIVEKLKEESQIV